MPLNRLVALLTPLLALAAGACATWLAEHFPGVDIPADTLQSIFIAGAVAVLAPALHWLHGWQKWEARDAAAQAAADASDNALAVSAPVVAEEDDELDFDFDDDPFEAAELEDEVSAPPAGVA